MSILFLCDSLALCTSAMGFFSVRSTSSFIFAPRISFFGRRLKLSNL